MTWAILPAPFDELLVIVWNSGLCESAIANRITFVVISEKKGEQIAALVDNGTRVVMRIGIGARGVFRFGTINKTSVLFVSISFILLMIISFAWLVFYYVQRFRYIHAKEILSVSLTSDLKIITYN
ncbi:hypothetical protein AVEN_161688-1 [Araneus ventricosus]|uniref:Uncharacterized protein n=1 Tax=Araneus ventricosus TaxID=182803 RepID=A0A4Y2EQR0_ARAVE|nr:hypothetical protein AVEN_161688-1 [Araneus ventricosus]